MSLLNKEKQTIIKKFARAKGDTGSPEVQIALLSYEIKDLLAHLKVHIHDAPAKRGLLSKIAKRRRLLRYLAAHDKDRYQKLIKELRLRK